MNINDLKKAIKSYDNDVLVDIDVSPNSNEFIIYGFNLWRNRFEVRIKQIPQKGKANKEIVNEFSKIFNCNVNIFKGKKSSQKTVILHDTSLDFVLDKLVNIINKD